MVSRAPLVESTETFWLSIAGAWSSTRLGGSELGQVALLPPEP